MQTRPPPGKAGSGPPTQLRCARKPASRLTCGQRDAGEQAEVKTNFVRFHSACSVSGGELVLAKRSVPDPPPDGPSPIGSPHPRTQAGCKLAFGRFHLSLLKCRFDADSWNGGQSQARLGLAEVEVEQTALLGPQVQHIDDVGVGSELEPIKHGGPIDAQV